MSILVTRPFGIGLAAGAPVGVDGSPPIEVSTLCWTITSLGGSPATPNAGFGNIAPESQGSPWDLTFKPDGTKCYLTDQGTTDRIYQYSLGTAWDITSISYDAVSFTSTNCAATDFKPNGRVVYILNRISLEIEQRTLSTPWDISTAGAVTHTYDLAAAIAGSPEGWTVTVSEAMYFSPDGTKLFTGMQTTSPLTRRLAQHTLSTPWDLSTASYDEITLNVGANGLTNVRGIEFCNTGERLFVIHDSLGFEGVSQWTMVTPFDFSGGTVYGGSWDGYKNPNGDINNEFILAFDTQNGNRIYIGGPNPNERIYQYDIPDPTLGL